MQEKPSRPKSQAQEGSRDRLEDGATRLLEPPHRELAEGLVRKLIESAGPETTSDVIFNVEVDGVRCVLVKERTAVAPCPNAEVEPGATLLSPREQEIARLIAKGHSNKTIAAVLEISPWTVSTHVRRIFTKLGVTSRTAMVSWAFEQGLIK